MRRRRGALWLTGAAVAALAMTGAVPWASATTAAEGEPAERGSIRTKRVDWTGEISSGTGSTVSQGPCDVNADGHDDVVAGAWFWDKAAHANVGGAYVLLGAPRPAGGDLGNPRGASAVQIIGPDQRSALTGFAVACLGDTDRDGFDDIAVSDYVNNRIYVLFGDKYFGTVNLTHLGDRGYLLQGPQDGGNFGFAVAGVGDIDGDKRADIAIAEVAADTQGRTNNGRIWLVKGGSGTATVQATGERLLGTIDGEATNDRMSSVSEAGDVDGDGLRDLVVGAYVAAPHGDAATAAGAAYVIRGAAQGFGAVDTAALGDRGFRIVGAPRGRDRLGISVAGAGDINADGLADLVIGADGVSSSATGPRQGGAAIVYGSASSAEVTVDPLAATPVSADGQSRGWWIDGAADGDSAGYSVDGVGDINNDNLPDVLIGAYGADPLGLDGKPMSGAGAAYLVYGRTNASVVELSGLTAQTGLAFAGTEAGQRYGRAVGAAGDVDANREPDIAVGGDAPGSGYSSTGIVSVELTGVPRTSGASSGIKVRTEKAPAIANGVKKAPASHSFGHINWVPSEQDTCSTTVHQRWSVVAADGKQYPTWHPARVKDPKTGKSCTFGHEHGDNPRTSDIYPWVSTFLSSPKLNSKGIPFGVAAEASMVHGEGHAMRSEDHAGHKVIVADNVPLLQSGSRAPVTAKGKAVNCDYLLKIHQGSHSADATKNNAHELIYAMRCSDGAQMIATTLSLFGNANEYSRACDTGVTVTTSGAANTPNGYGGRRLIPDTACIDEHVLVEAGERSDIWSLYEVWESVNRLSLSDGTVLAEYEPWFAVRNPSRYADTANPGQALPVIGTRWATDPADGGTAYGLPWASIPQAPQQPQSWIGSPFDGAQRDYYLSGTGLTNSTGKSVVYSDPYGGNVSTRAFPGSVKQFVATRTSPQTQVERNNLGLDDDYGQDVHTPN